MTGQFTGRHVAGILVAFFAVVIAANVTMARFAASTFGGEVVENSYVASQHFNRWLDEAASERARGLEADVSRRTDGRVEGRVSGAGIESLAAIARHPLGRLSDRKITFDRAADGKFVSRQILPAGRWRLRLTVVANGKTWRAERELH